MSKKNWGIGLLAQALIFANFMPLVSPNILIFAMGLGILLFDIALFLDSKGKVLVIFPRKPFVEVRTK